jgi:hypothetical protein
MNSGWIPRRLFDAWVGATVTATLPAASLWAPTYRRHTGFGIDPQPCLLLFQCSPAQYRIDGPSTRVSRRLLQIYRSHPALVAWHDRTQFVLADPSPDEYGPHAYSTSPAKRPLPTLWTASVPILADVTDHQDRGTVSAATLRSMASAGEAIPLAHTLRTWAETTEQRQTHTDSIWRAPLEPTDADPWFWGGLFGVNRPMPLGAALPVLHARGDLADRESRDVIEVIR